MLGAPEKFNIIGSDRRKIDLICVIASVPRKTNVIAWGPRKIYIIVVSDWGLTNIYIIGELAFSPRKIL